MVELLKAGLELSRTHYEIQRDERLRMLNELSGLWSLFDPFDFVTFEGFSQTASLVLMGGWEESALASERYYENLRIAEGIVGSALDLQNIGLVRPPPREEIEATLRANGIVGVLTARRAGQSMEQAKANGFVRVAGAASRIVQNGGRQQLLSMVKADPARPKWYRRTSRNPCAFCRMLASRGAAYVDEVTADFPAHDHCACFPEPLFEGAELPEQNRRFADDWRKATRGLRGREAAIAFRQEVEGRAASDWPATGHLPAALSRELAEGERISDTLRGVEHFRAYTSDGSLVFDKGPGAPGVVAHPDGSYSIEFTEAETANLRALGDAAEAAGEPFVVTHNHPGGYDFTDPDDPRRSGNAFSTNDWMYAAQINASEMRAISRDWIHSVRRPAGGWQIQGDGGLAHRLQFWNVTVRGEGMRRIEAVGYGTAEAEALIPQLEAEHWHLVAENVARDIGATYTRTPRETTS